MHIKITVEIITFMNGRNFIVENNLYAVNLTLFPAGGTTVPLENASTVNSIING